MLAATETAAAAIAGTLLGRLLFEVLRPVVAGQVTLGHGTPVFAGDLAVPLRPQLIVLLGVPLLAVATTIVALRPVQLAPLAARSRVRRRPPSGWRLAPVAAGLGGVWFAVRNPGSPASGVISVLSVTALLAGFFLAGAWACMWLGRGMARVGRSFTTLIVARRIAADPYGTFRAVGGAGIAVYAAALLGYAAAGDPAGRDDQRVALDPPVVAVHVQGVAEESLAPLRTAGTVVVRVAPGSRLVVPCAELARVTDLGCPLPQYREDGDHGRAYLRAEDVFVLPYPGASGADGIFRPAGFAEPGPGAGRLPVQTLLIPTDGTAAARERVRTLAAVTVPSSRSRVSDDLAAGPPVDVHAFAAVLPYAMVFVLVFAACSLTVSVIAGVLERRRPFALLRASGVRLGELRRIVLLETGAPLALAVLFGAGLAAVEVLAPNRPADWVLPSGEFFAGLGLGALAAFVVSLAALPFLEVATRLDTARFE
jgi:hypothetical protein